MQPLTQYDEKLLLKQISTGDQQSFRRLFDLYKERIFTFVYGLTHSKAEAEEIVQDIFMKLWESGPTLTSIDFPQGYIFTMARNRTLDILAKKGRDEKLIREVWANISQSEDITEQLLEAKESQRLIYEAVAELSERKQKIFDLSRNKGLSHDEIASHLGISKQTVKNNLSEALKEIKCYLEKRSHLLAIIFWIYYFQALFTDL